MMMRALIYIPAYKKHAWLSAREPPGAMPRQGHSSAPFWVGTGSRTAGGQQAYTQASSLGRSRGRKCEMKNLALSSPPR